MHTKDARKAKRKLLVARRAYKLLAKPERWTQGVLAKDSFGEAIDPLSLDAACWCAQGAIMKTYYKKPTPTLMISNLSRLRKKLATSIGEWNDNSTHEEVYEMLKRLDI